MSYPIYFILAMVALLLNFKNKGNLELLGIIVLSFYFPTEYITNHYWWWSTVFVFDATVLLITIYSNSLVSKSLFLVTLMLINAHLLAYNTKVYNLYSTIAQYLEHLQIVCFILCAPSPVYYLKRKVRGWTKRYGCGC